MNRSSAGMLNQRAVPVPRFAQMFRLLFPSLACKLALKGSDFMYLPRKQLPLIALCLAAVIFAVFLSMENDSWIGIALLLFFGALPALVLAYYIIRYIVIAVYSYFQLFLEWLYSLRHK